MVALAPPPRPYTREDGRRFIASQILLNPSESPSWAIEHQGNYIGGINLRFHEAHRVAELGYSVVRPLWGSGIATEAAKGVIGAAFAQVPHLNRVRAMAHAENIASRRVLEKLGMRHEGTLRSNRYLRDEPLDEAWYGVLRPEWKTAR